MCGCYLRHVRVLPVTHRSFHFWLLPLLQGSASSGMTANNEQKRKVEGAFERALPPVRS